MRATLASPYLTNLFVPTKLSPFILRLPQVRSARRCAVERGIPVARSICGQDIPQRSWSSANKRPDVAKDRSLYQHPPSHVPCRSRRSGSRSTPDTAWPVTGHPPGSSRNLFNAPVSMSSQVFDASSAVHLRSPSRSPSDTLTMCLFLNAHHNSR
jgi:hypothetical protein